MSLISVWTEIQADFPCTTFQQAGKLESILAELSTATEHNGIFTWLTQMDIHNRCMGYKTNAI